MSRIEYVDSIEKKLFPQSEIYWRVFEYLVNRD